MDSAADGILTVIDLMRARQGQTRDEFVMTHPYPYLIDQSGGSAVATPKGGYETTQTSLESYQALMQAHAAKTIRSLVLPIVKKGSGIFAGMINVGRTHNNDVVISSGEVSKFHAYFTKDPVQGGYSLTDVGSTNGTWVNGVKLEPRQAMLLNEGAILNFAGQRELLFYTPQGVYDFMGQFSGLDF